MDLTGENASDSLLQKPQWVGLDGFPTSAIDLGKAAKLSICPLLLHVKYTQISIGSTILHFFDVVTY
jgi:hypothetical protein